MGEDRQSAALLSISLTEIPRQSLCLWTLSLHWCLFQVNLLIDAALFVLGSVLVVLRYTHDQHHDLVPSRE
jgi:hypothetical protein